MRKSIKNRLSKKNKKSIKNNRKISKIKSLRGGNNKTNSRRSVFEHFRSLSKQSKGHNLRTLREINSGKYK
jgi:hypothetical protein